MSAPRDLWLSPDGLARLARGQRLCPVLLRFDQGRCRAPAQDCAGLISGMESAGWRLRDASCTSDAVRQQLTAECALDRGGDAQTCGCQGCRRMFQ